MTTTRRRCHRELPPSLTFPNLPMGAPPGSTSARPAAAVPARINLVACWFAGVARRAWMDEPDFRSVTRASSIADAEPAGPPNTAAVSAARGTRRRVPWKMFIRDVTM